MRRLQKVHWIKTIGRFLFPLFFLLLLESGSAFPQEQKFLSLTLKEKKIRVEVVRTEGEKAKGLMFREKLGKNEGMLFVYEREETLSFWMKNTRIPLSIAFIAKNGKIVDIQNKEKLDLITLETYSRVEGELVTTGRYTFAVRR